MRAGLNLPIIKIVMKVKFIPLTIIFFLLTSLCHSFDLPLNRIEDDSYLRASLMDSWLRNNFVNVAGNAQEVYTLRGGTQVHVRMETSPRNLEEFAIVLARGQSGNFSSWNQGSWSLIRRRDNNPQGSRIQYFPRTDFNTYIQFRPFNNERSFMDVVVYDAFLIRSLPLPVPFERLLTMPMEEIFNLAGRGFPGHYFEPIPAMYRDSMDLISALRPRLQELVFMDDGAINENGEFIFIESLLSQEGSGGVNCSGFAKWVVDGILRPFTGERLSIAPLKLPFGDRGSTYTDVWEDLRDPFFGLDWIRNLASTAGITILSPSFSNLDEIEVRSFPYSQLNTRLSNGGIRISNPEFIENAGFPVESLLPLLYSLAINEPGHIYLAAVNNEIGLPTTQVNPRGIPRMRQYYHVAVIIPFFNERGTFQVAVFESAAETSITAFISRYPGESVNLVRIPIDGRFDP